MPLTAVLIGPGGQGKDHLAVTAPGPILIADFEGNAHKLPRPYQVWDPETETCPSGLTAEDIVVVVSETVKSFTELVNFIHSDKSPFVSFILSSITVLAQIAEVEMVGNAKDARQDYKALLWELRPALTTLKHSIGRKDRALDVFIMTAWQRQDKQAISVAGALAEYCNQMNDVSGYVSLDVVDGKLANRMRVWAAPNGGDPKAKGTAFLYTQMEQTGPHAGTVLNPNFTEISNQLSQMSKEITK